MYVLDFFEKLKMYYGAESSSYHTGHSNSLIFNGNSLT